MSSFFSVLLVLGGLIFFHELGHYLAARVLGIGVHTFSLGFGPRIFGWRSGQTDYRLSLIPLGGYVSLAGESDDEIPEGFTKGQMFSARPAWHRLIVIAAGPVFNLLLAWFIYWGLTFVHGQFIVLPEVGKVLEGGPAAAAGVQSGDRIVAIDGVSIERWDQVSDAIAASKGAPVTLSLTRNEGQHELRIVPEHRTRKTIFGDEEDAFLIGIQASGATMTLPQTPVEAAVTGARQTWTMIAMTGKGVVKLFERVVPLDTVGGPIMIAQMVSREAKDSGITGVLALAALISINLGLLNLLPIPVLDGGHIIFLGLEMLFRRPVPQKVQEVTTRMGLVLLLGLMFLATYNDIVRIGQ
ncbi:RIP metalloprotease RseP [Nitratidesulfovibrio vulgaris]|jgi:regulator of sigma E protease|uniref:Zinc metalloprotease n=1 Tax=Nitratidesulfovibrio vulgaris (strain ATCC 29579 / DSM 644 / CCUG 34227 / NCIMB 8303 / VKM B-1760 / Hildenborough) TaxID=882 RepID=Q72DR4_NITV2|nr:RIP metalloprotease RseP [Nitratidesulfovibrio vulgaris]AAS95345.1 membrane-associated zinc metalloprotease, putative [Nitratidesulfovibrio vulgaris str. Hildenborough]ADP85960.1 membrane-associated zinc metalloprotease [Nitratidesulfovibrio vulgaris RCH1]WCB47513.1 RIP metalloprotease RseP [Nitratidesulfovibrio vulgaris]HBW14764.1 RIP metalloprotease RseP [Desulfovibrio sp.]